MRITFPPFSRHARRSSLASVVLMLVLSVAAGLGLTAATNVATPQPAAAALTCVGAVRYTTYNLYRSGKATSHAKLRLHHSTEGDFTAAATHKTSRKYRSLKMSVSVAVPYGLGWKTIATQGPRTSRKFVGCVRNKPAAGACRTARFTGKAWIGGKVWSRIVSKRVCNR